jgi:hypothetical protein
MTVIPDKQSRHKYIKALTDHCFSRIREGITMGQFARFISVITIGFIFTGCGDSGVNFSSVGGKFKTFIEPEEDKDPAEFRNSDLEKKSKDAEGKTSDDPIDPIEIPLTSELNWLWPCAGESLDAPSSGVTIEGAGDFELVNDGSSAVSVNIKGGYCQPAKSMRDITFVIDVSSSMHRVNLFGVHVGNDPLKNGSCGRYEAVKAVVDSLGPNDRVSLVTFGEKIYRSSAYETAANFLKSGMLSTDALCEIGDDTDFGIALAKTEEIMLDARLDSFKEVYFISDGIDDRGVEEAKRIQQYATISTLMLKGNDSVLKKNIASKDANGDAIHVKVEEAAELTQALKELTESSLVSGTFSYNSDDSDLEDTQLNIESGKYFTIDTIEIDPVKHPNGMNFEVDFVDTLGRHYGGTAKLSWK